MNIFLTAGLGDFISILSFIDEQERSKIDKIYMATRAKNLIECCIDNYPIFPNLKEKIIVKENDFIVCPLDYSEVYRIAKKEFFETYKPDE